MATVTKEPTVRVPLIGPIRIKYIALILLIAQTVGGILAIRISRVKGGNVKYLNTTAVFMSELFKVIGSLLLVWHECQFSISKTTTELHAAIILQPMETLKVGIPAFLYTLQNNLLFIALSNMSAAVYQVTYQLKILTTALLSVLLLHTVLSPGRWISLLLLASGVACVQLPSEGHLSNEQGHLIVGLVAVLSACLTSGFAGVYFEKILKTSPVSIWTRNIQLGMYGSIIGLIGAYWNDGEAIQSDGFFQGYDSLTWVVILFQSAGGLIVAAVLKYADNILKCFGNALAIVVSFIVSYVFLHDVVLSLSFLVGSSLVILAVYTYTVDMNVVRLCLKSVGVDQSMLSQEAHVTKKQQAPSLDKSK